MSTRPSITRPLTAAAISSLLLVLTACGGSGDTEQTPSTEAAATSAAVDHTAALQAVDSSVTSAIETEPGRIEVATDLVDPRGDDGSPEAAQAVAICEAAVDILGDAVVRVNVAEADGTTWVVFSTTPLPGDAPTGQCVEL